MAVCYNGLAPIDGGRCDKIQAVEVFTMTNTKFTTTNATTQAFDCPFITFSVTVPAPVQVVPVQKERTHAHVNETKAIDDEQKAVVNEQKADEHNTTAQPDFVGTHTFTVGKKSKKRTKKEAKSFVNANKDTHTDKKQKPAKSAKKQKPMTEKQARKNLENAYNELAKARAQKKNLQTAKMHIKQAELLLENIKKQAA